MQRGPPVRDPTPWDAVLTVGRRPPGRKGPPRESRHTRHSGKWEKDQEAGRHRHFHGQQQGGEGQRDVLCPMGSSGNSAMALLCRPGAREAKLF